MFSNPFESKKFLVVDDFGDMRSMLKSIVRMIGGVSIDTASSGRGAIEAIERTQYDIILCDYNLGNGKDGLQVLEEVRHRKLISMSAIFIMVTAENTRLMVMGAIEYEPDAYLSKPFSKDLIKSRIEKVMEKKKDLGIIYNAIDQRQLDKAILLLDQKLTEKRKNASELIRIKADICLQAKKYACSAEIYERILALRDVPWAMLGLGKVLFARKKYQEATAIFRGLSESNPDMVVAMDWLAKTYHVLNELGEAKDIVEAAVDISPKSVLRQQKLGDLRMQAEDYAAAEDAFNETVRLSKHSVHNHPSMYAKLAKCQTSQGKHDVALNSTRQIEKTFGKNADASFYVAVTDAVIYHNKNDTKSSEQALSRATRLYGNAGEHISSDITLELAQAASHVGNIGKAKALLKTAIQNNHDNDEFLQNVTVALRSSGLSKNPEDFVANLKKEVVEMNNQGVNLLKRGKLAEALALFKEAAAQMTGNQIINLNAARTLLMVMEKDGAKTESLSQIRQYIDRLKRMNSEDVALKSLLSRLQKVVAAA